MDHFIQQTEKGQPGENLPKTANGVLAGAVLEPVNRLQTSRTSTGLEILIGTNASRLCNQWRQALGARFQIHEVDHWGALETCLRTRRPSVLLLDLSFPEIGETQPVAAIHCCSPSTHIIFFTDAPDHEEAIRLFKAGARGYCSRNITPSLLRKAVEVVQKGEIWVGRYVIPHLLEELKNHVMQKSVSSGKDVLSNLSGRELEIARLISRGGSNKEIAYRLKINEKTVKSHVTSIFRKLNVSSRLQLALLITAHSPTTG